MDFSWATEGITDEVPRTTGPECINYMTNRRRWLENIIFTIIFIAIIRRSMRSMKPIVLPQQHEIDKPHSAIRLLLIISMTFVFGMEMGFKFAGKSVIFVLNPCHIQTIVQIFLLASKPNKVTIALFRIQMNNLNGPFLAFLFPEVEFRDLPFEQATYWIQHALLYIIPIYILRSGAYEMEEMNDYNWVAIGVSIMLMYHFAFLSTLSMFTGINLSHMLCAAQSDPFQGNNYRIAAVIHEAILCPILNKGTVYLFNPSRSNNANSNDQNAISSQCNYSQLSSTNMDKLPSILLTNKSKRLSVGNIDESIIGNAADTDLLYHQQRTDHLTPTAPILKHRRRHTTEYIYDGPNDMIIGDLASSTTVMPTTKID